MTTLVFPGQGSQYVGMGKDFYDNFEAAKNIFNLVEQCTNIKVKEIIFENNDIKKIKSSSAISKLKRINPDIQLKSFNKNLTIININQIAKKFDEIYKKTNR